MLDPQRCLCTFKKLFHLHHLEMASTSPTSRCAWGHQPPPSPPLLSSRRNTDTIPTRLGSHHSARDTRVEAAEAWSPRRFAWPRLQSLASRGFEGLTPGVTFELRRHPGVFGYRQVYCPGRRCLGGLSIFLHASQNEWGIGVIPNQSGSGAPRHLGIDPCII